MLPLRRWTARSDESESILPALALVVHSAVAPEGLFVILTWSHVDPVADSSTFPRSLLGANFRAESDVKRSSDFRLSKQRQPFEPAGAKLPFAFLVMSSRNDQFTVVVFKPEMRLWAAIRRVHLLCDISAPDRLSPEMIPPQVVKAEANVPPLLPWEMFAPRFCCAAVVGLRAEINLKEVVSVPHITQGETKRPFVDFIVPIPAKSLDGFLVPR